MPPFCLPCIDLQPKIPNAYRNKTLILHDFFNHVLVIGTRTRFGSWYQNCCHLLAARAVAPVSVLSVGIFSSLMPAAKHLYPLPGGSDVAAFVDDLSPQGYLWGWREVVLRAICEMIAIRRAIAMSSQAAARRGAA